MARVYTPHSCIHQSSNTATTGGTVFLTGAAPAGSFNFRDLYPDGATVPLELLDATSGQHEYSYGTLVYGASAILDKIQTRTPTGSSNGYGIPVAWGAGTRNAFAMACPEDNLSAPNGLGELTPAQVLLAQAVLGLGSAAYMPGSRVGVVPVGPNGSVDGIWTGGTVGKVVRAASANTMTDASNLDTAAQLLTVAFKVSSLYYQVVPGVIPGFAGGTFTTGASYYLGTAGAMVTPGPTVTPGGSAKLLILGWAPSPTSFFWQPRLGGKG